MVVVIATAVAALIGLVSLLGIAAIVRSWMHGDTSLVMWRGVVGPYNHTTIQPTNAMELLRRVGSD